jgi:hypothetical protein
MYDNQRNFIVNSRRNHRADDELNLDSKVAQMAERGLIIHKTQGGRGTRRTYDIDLYRRVVETSSRFNEGSKARPGGGGNPGRQQLQSSLLGSREVATIEKVNTIKEKERPCYIIPPLRDVWSAMVKAGFIHPDDVMPIEENEEENEGGNAKEAAYAGGFVPAAVSN